MPKFRKNSQIPSDPPYKDGMHKFSSKPPGHEAARLRENQRRHRARVKGRITDLETALDDTQERLNNALSRIEDLTAEVHRLQLALGESQQGPVLRGHDHAVPDPILPLESRPNTSSLESHCCNRTTTCGPEPDEISQITARKQTQQDLIVLSADELSPAQDATHYTNKPGVPGDTVAKAGDDPTDDCPSLPPPSPGESTMTCREAYAMIKDRIMPDFDPELVTEWLKPGFRRATCPGDGCRVQTHILFALVDHITSV
ncbi:hypothetical protein B0H66DRAFT_560136 [Apodospora peruviana]|uniref:Uncharacterized protein n=1 Tax=Apodospora peruviana TaxID=516989 RepID=A0AAE0M255_9PEZI|nr:hypothetical protein B0H66DRAFT_560136 [Apodospora peruviana]